MEGRWSIDACVSEAEQLQERKKLQPNLDVMAVCSQQVSLRTVRAKSYGVCGFDWGLTSRNPHSSR